jgi:hypothetical protein
VAYFANYIPLLRLIVLPLQQMVPKGVFTWEKIHQLSYDTMSLLCSLKFENATIDQKKPLFVSCDSSQIAVGLLAFQLDDDGEMILIFTDTQVLKQGDCNRSSSFRELLALLFGVTAMENEIRSHSSEVVLLTDCISLSLLYRQTFHNSRLLEISIYLWSFTIISIQYCVGPSLFVADFISHRTNNVFLENNSEISQEFAELILLVWNLTFFFIVLRSGKISCQFQPMNKIDCQSIEWEKFL